MGIKESIEKSPWKHLIGTIITSVIFTSGILLFFQKEKIESVERLYETKLQECSNTLTSINRGLGGSTDLYFNVNQVFVNSSDKLENASQLIYYNSDEFYALADSSYWKHIMIDAYISAIEFSKLDKLDRSKAIESLKKHKSKVHYWVGGKLYFVQNSKMFDSLGYKSINTSISVEKVNIDTLAMLNAEAQHHGYVKEYLDFYRKQGLMTTFLYFIEQQRLMTSKFPEVSFEIQDIQSRDKFIYLKAISQIKNVTINGILKENFYMKYESFGLLSNNDIYSVTIVEPVTDILYSDPEITRWLNSLKIILK